MDDLLDEIRRYCGAAGITPSTLSRYAVNDGGFVRRLEAGGQCLPRTAEKVRAYMRRHPPDEKGGTRRRSAA